MHTHNTRKRISTDVILDPRKRSLAEKEIHAVLNQLQLAHDTMTGSLKGGIESIDDIGVQLTIGVTQDTPVVICVVGVGYVGEHLVSVFGSKYNVIGFDVSPERIGLLQENFKDYSKVNLTTDKEVLRKGTHYLISVPTLLSPEKTVNTSHLLKAIETVVEYARPGSTIVIESSVSVGMTRSLLGPYSQKYHCGMSPERVDPGRVSPAAHEIPKVISGLDAKALASINNVYSQVFNRVVPVSQPEVAEMTKLYENCYRMINIAYVNEIADACENHGINANEVIDAASTKPFGFQPFRPGLGIGGHCIPINPYYLMANNNLPLLKSATTKMWNRPKRLAKDFLNQLKMKDGLRSPRVLIVGVGFKPGQSVISCSPAVQFAATLKVAGCKNLAFYDPLVEQKNLRWMRKLKSSHWNVRSLDSEYDAIVVCVKQTKVDFSILEKLGRARVTYF